MNFQNPKVDKNIRLAENSKFEITTYEASLIIAVRTVTLPWFTGVVEQIIPYIDLLELDNFAKGTVVMGSYFPGYFWLEKDKE